MPLLRHVQYWHGHAAAVLGRGYAMSSTDIGYAPTRSQPPSSSPSLRYMTYPEPTRPYLALTYHGPA
eukprot:632721-Rhodomonas_salina.2